jgi:eukaryotic-like serine/threonine-protein kinase
LCNLFRVSGVEACYNTSLLRSCRLDLEVGVSDGNGLGTIVRFGEFEVVLRSGELRTNGTSVKLQPQPAKILALLVRRRGETVTRDEIVAEVWGTDTFVDYERGLNYAIRQIRNALGDDAEHPSYIETIPKRGYRFVGNVAADNVAVSKPPNFRPLALSALAIAVVLGLLAGLNIGGVQSRLTSLTRRAPLSRPVIRVRRSVAVVGFKNLSGRSDAAWLGSALADMLTTELGAGEQLRTIPEENVARALTELLLATNDAYGRDTLQHLRIHLGTDLVIAGSYMDLGEKSGGQVRVDLRIQDASAGETIASVSEIGSEADLFQLIAHAGADLRRRLRVSEIPPTDLASAQASYPSAREVARLYAEGLEKLRQYDSVAAKTLLEGAVAADPKYPLSHSALAMAWSSLGYDAKAQEEAKTAFELSGNLSREERLLVEGKYRELAKEWDLAIDIYHTLFTFFPDDLDYGLRLASCQSSGGRPKDALATLDVLRKLQAPLGDDPRIDREEAHAFDSLGDLKKQLAAATTAVQKAEAQGARLLAASSRLSECHVMGAYASPSESRAQCERAKQTFISVGDRNGVATAIDFMGLSFFYEGNLAEAKKLDEQALAIFHETGNRRREGLVLTHLANVAWQLGDLEAAQKGYSAAFANYQEVGDKLNVAAAKDNLGNVLYLKGDLVASQRFLQEALEGFREVGSKTSVANALENLASTAISRGDLRAARKMLEEALVIVRAQEIKSEIAWALTGFGDIDITEGKLADAGREYKEALSFRTEIGEKGSIAESQLSLANLALEEGRPTDAEGRLRDAQQEFLKEKQVDDELLANTFLARAFLAQRKYVEAEKEIRDGNVLASHSQNSANRLQFRIAATELETARGLTEPARQALMSILAEATRTGFLEYQFEARLALGEVEIRSGRVAAGKTRLTTLQKDAQAKGFLLIARKAAYAPDLRAVHVSNADAASRD